MSTHIDAERGKTADFVLMPGDPLRAQHMARQFLTDVVPTNQVRGMLGFTGTVNGRRVTIQGSGMGIPSFLIYGHELITEYGVRTIIRVGTCGAFQDDLELGDVVLAMTASTDSNINKRRFQGLDFAPAADFDLLRRAYETAVSRNIPVHVGGVLSSDTFYVEDFEGYWGLWAENGVLAVEMETAALYSLAAQFGIRALSILTVCDKLFTDEHASTEARQTAYTDMFEIALTLMD